MMRIGGRDRDALIPVRRPEDGTRPLLDESVLAGGVGKRRGRGGEVGLHDFRARRGANSPGSDARRAGRRARHDEGRSSCCCSDRAGRCAVRGRRSSEPAEEQTPVRLLEDGVRVVPRGDETHDRVVVVRPREHGPSRDIEGAVQVAGAVVGVRIERVECAVVPARRDRSHRVRQLHPHQGTRHRRRPRLVVDQPHPGFVAVDRRATFVTAGGTAAGHNLIAHAQHPVCRGAGVGGVPCLQELREHATQRREVRPVTAEDPAVHQGAHVEQGRTDRVPKTGRETGSTRVGESGDSVAQRKDPSEGEHAALDLGLAGSGQLRVVELRWIAHRDDEDAEGICLLCHGRGDGSGRSRSDAEADRPRRESCA